MLEKDNCEMQIFSQKGVTCWVNYSVFVRKDNCYCSPSKQKMFEKDNCEMQIFFTKRLSRALQLDILNCVLYRR